MWIGVVPALVLMGCGTTPTLAPEATDQRAPIGPPRVEARAELATEEQQPYFADGAIDFAEYEEAVFATVACVEARGFAVEAELAADGLYQYVNPVIDGFDTAFAACREQWSRQVELAFQEAQLPSVDQQAAALETISCLIDAGAPPSQGSRPDQLRAFIDGLPAGSPARACGALLSGQ